MKFASIVLLGVLCAAPATAQQVGEYTGTMQDGSSVTTAQNTSAATSVATPGGATTLTLFPNPVRDAFLLQLNNSLAGKMQVKVVDV